MFNELENHMVVDDYWDDEDIITPHDRYEKEQEAYEREEYEFDRGIERAKLENL